MPTETDVMLAAEIKGVFERLSADIRDSNLRQADAINGVARDLGSFRVEVAKELGTINADLGSFRVEVAKDLGELRTGVAKDLGAINTNLEGFRGRTETSFKVAVWGISLAAVSLLGGFGFALTLTWRAAHVDAAVTELREHAKEQDARISELIKLGAVQPSVHRGPTPPIPPDGSRGSSNVGPPPLDENKKAQGPDRKRQGNGG
jgi:hypothetical protein